MMTSTPAPSCRSCGSFPALPDGELCNACRHAVEVHGASFVDAYAVPCEGCDRPQIQTSPEAPIPCINCGSPACEWPGECDTKTIAERISRRFDDGQRWRDANGTSLEDACTEANGRLDRSDEDDKDRYTFPDGSVLTLCDGGWDLGYPDCFCWQGGGHGDDCPACCDNCGADLHEGACPNCAGDPLEVPEEILDILNALIEWDEKDGRDVGAIVMDSGAEIWQRARAIRDRLVVR